MTETADAIVPGPETETPADDAGQFLEQFAAGFPDHASGLAAPFASLARKLCEMPPSAGRKEALQHLLTSRDAAVRVFLGK